LLTLYNIDLNVNFCGLVKENGKGCFRYAIIIIT
jgi:hypothetical protein